MELQVLSFLEEKSPGPSWTLRDLLAPLVKVFSD